MTGALDPSLAVQYLELLSCDLDGVGVFGADGELLAGEARDSSTGTRVRATADGVTIAATVKPKGLKRLVEHDLAAALGAMHA